MRVTTSCPGSAGSEVNEMPALPRKSFALSQGVKTVVGRVKMWNLQSVAETVICVESWNFSRAGLTKWVRPLKSGK